MNKLIFLGTGGASSLTRHMTSILFVTDEKNFLIDCGDGTGTVRHITRSGVKLETINDIFLTHRHADHILGISPLLFFKVMRDTSSTIRVYGPEDTMKHAKDISYNIHDLTRANSQRISFLPMKTDASVTIGKKISVSCLPVNHTHGTSLPTYAYKIDIGGTIIVFSADMLPSKEFNVFTQGADILIHEVFDVDKNRDFTRKCGHCTARDAAETAEQAHVKQLILTHFRDEPAISLQALQEETRTYFSGKVTLATDMMEVVM